MSDNPQPDRARDLLAAGFSADEVAAWSSRQRQTLSTAGFSDPEIDAYIGGKPPPAPMAFFDRFNGMELGRAAGPPPTLGGPEGPVGRLGGFLTGIAKGVGLPADELKAQAASLPLSEAAGVALGRLPAGMVIDQIREGGKTLEAAMSGRPVSAEEMAGAAMLGLTGPVSRLPGGLPRLEINPIGQTRGLPVGGMPQVEDFANATRSVVGDTPAPQAYSKVEQLWSDHGIHPAEVAHEAARDVTIAQDLAGGRLPEAYVPPTPEPMPDIVPGGPPQIQSYPPGALRVDPQRFQFKEGGDAAGVSQRLAGVTQWDPIKAGVGVVWEDESGNPFIVDGHQRLGLANRIAENDPSQQPLLNAWTLRAADGVSDTEARAIAAAKNIAEGTGTPVDAAKVLRDRPDLLPTLPPRSEVVRQAQGLMNLSDDAFGKVVNDVVPPNYGAIVGRLAPEDPVMQSALINLLHETAPENVTQAESIVRQGLDAGVHEGTQATLFGPEQMATSLFGERARVLDRALKQLRRDKTVFQSIVDNSDIIKELGNQLAQDENLRRAAIDGQAAQILQTLANRKGQLSDSLTAAARAVADGSATPAAAARDFVAEIRRQAESGDLSRLANGGSGSAVAAAGESRPSAARGAETGVRDVAPAEDASATAATQEAIRATVEKTEQGEQLVIPGAERSAQQAAASREAEGHGRIASPTTQQEPGGLFAPKEPEQPSLLSRLAASEEGSLRLAKEEPPRTPAEQSILSRLSIGESDAGRKWTWARFYTAMVDRLNPIERVTKQLAGDHKLAVADDAYKLARLYAGVSGKADQFLQHGTFQFGDYASSGKPLKEVLAPVAEDLNGFRSYAVALHALELEGQGIKTGVDLAAARDVWAQGHGKYASVMADFVAYQNKLIAYLRDAGVLSQQSYDAMTAKYQAYVPFQRVFGDVMGDIIPDAIRGAGKTLQASDPIHEIVGSQRRIIDPLESAMRNTYLSLMMAERNAVGTKLIDLIEKAGGLPTPERTDTISIFRNGVRETHEVGIDLAAAIKGLDEESANTMLRLLGAPARMLRAGATLTPDFMARNLIRDFFSAVINTSKGVFHPVDTAKGLMSAIYKDAHFQEWLKGGGANSVLVSLDRRYLQNNIAKLTEDTGIGTRAWNVILHPIDTLRAISQLSEEATRLGEFRAARRQELAAGAAPKEASQAAAFTSREVTLDFARRGSATQAMNMITAFWNAQVQGVDRLARAFRDNPAGTSLKIAAGITLPSVLLWANNHNDPRWQEIPSWERDLFWIILTGGPDDPKAPIFRIPKPFEVGVIFGSGPERLLDAYVDQRPDAFKDFAGSVASALAPGFVPTVALPLIEQFANRSTFTNRTLIPQGQEKHLPEYQYTPYTTEFAKALGQIIGAFPGVRDVKLDDGLAAGVARSLSTPILMENYVRAWTGGLGMYVLQAGDAALRKAGVLPDPAKPSDTLADIPFVKAFVVRYPSAGAESIQRFYDDYDKNKVYFDTWKAKAQEGDVAAMQHIQDAGGPRMFVQLDAFKETLATQAKAVRDVYQNPDMPPEEKRQLIDQLYYTQIQEAQAGMSVMRQIDASLNAQ